MVSILDPIGLNQLDNKIKWGNLTGCSFALAMAQLATQHAAPYVIITQDIHTAEQLKREILFFTESKLNVQLFPDWETLPFDHFSPHEDIVSKRLALLNKLPQLTHGIVIASIHTLMHKLAPKQHVQGQGVNLKINDNMDLTAFCTQLTHAGYHHVEQVIQHGEFAHRGAIIDFFPMGYAHPIRIELFDDEIASLRSFNVDTQRTIQQIKQIKQILPAYEFPLTTEAIDQFKQNWRERFTNTPRDASMYQAISNGQAAAGCQYYLPLFFTQLASLFDYLPKETILLLEDTSLAAGEHFTTEIIERHEQLQYDITRPICPPNELFLSCDNFLQGASHFSQIKWSQAKLTDKTGHTNYSTKALPQIAIEHQKKEPLSALKTWLTRCGQRVLFCTQSAGRCENVQELLKEHSIETTKVTSWHEFNSSDIKLGIIVGEIETGCQLIPENITIISENELYGQQPKIRKNKQTEIDPDLIIRNLLELQIGAPVVHVEMGIGRYQGLSVIATDGIEAEYLTLEYANNDKVYIPIYNLHLILRYTGGDADNAPLQKLGNKQWDKAKQKAQRRATDVAAELLKVYSQRQIKQGFAFNAENINYPTFCQQFGFMETPDQAKAITDVITDMQQDTPMDRLICGDVGFGKTEVAMRAAFIAAQNNKQTIILVPTTLLANQHLTTFSTRFALWPINLVILSRMQTTTQQRQALHDIETGKADIVIGTHKLLNQAIKYKDLGLLIIDEEHRFGVKQKEKIKSLRTNIDILTLTATPIPRTLNMALSGTRDLSIIATPPEKRLSIKTFVHAYDQSLIREAITRELMRGGQVIFLHNDIATIPATAASIKELIPQAQLAVAHAQLARNELESIMTGFYQQKFNILICTTIVESGIDIPTANTIIINKANRFGLAELHQLRGRVGRSHHQAYAYLLIADYKALNRDAKKRLEVISQVSHLGAGFSLATHDLEIRGAGELLGEEQSGHIHAIGFSLYLEMIEQAVQTLKTGQSSNDTTNKNNEVTIDLKTTALFPKEYISDVNIRLQIYKQLAECKSSEEVLDLRAQIIDRFGTLPPAAQQLFTNSKLKFYAQKNDIKSIELGSKYGYIQFTQNPKINFSKIIVLIQQQPKIYSLKGPDILRFKINKNDTQTTIQQIQTLMTELLTV